jgi:RNA recognition motif 2
MLLDEVDVNHKGTYDFFYLPIDFKNRCNVGYCFINFLDPRYIVGFVEEFNGQRWKNFNSEKVCGVTFARIQGKAAMISRFQNSSLLEKHDDYRPLLFYSSGPDRGKPELFPSSGRYKQTGNAKETFGYPSSFGGTLMYHDQDISQLDTFQEHE